MIHLTPTNRATLPRRLKNLDAEENLPIDSFVPGGWYVAKYLTQKEPIIFITLTNPEDNA